MSDCVFSLNGEDRVSFKFNFGPANLGMWHGELMLGMKLALSVYSHKNYDHTQDSNDTAQATLPTNSCLDGMHQQPSWRSPIFPKAWTSSRYVKDIQ